MNNIKKYIDTAMPYLWWYASILLLIFSNWNPNRVLIYGACILSIFGFIRRIIKMITHTKYGYFVINTSNPEKDIYTLKLDDLNKLDIKDSIILEVIIDNKLVSQ